MVFHSPLSLKYRGQLQKVFLPAAIMEAVDRRLYILNCFEGRAEGKDYQRPDIKEPFPSLLDQNAHEERIKRFSGTQNTKVPFFGIKGWCDVTGIDDTALTLLIAGELVHIGKNTSFGFGRYTIAAPG